MDTEKVKKTITELLARAGFLVTSIEVSHNKKDHSFWCDISTDKPGAFMAKRDDCLGALGHLAKKILEKDMSRTSIESTRDLVGPERLRLTVDVNGYHKARIEDLRSTAHMMAERARFLKSTVAFDPMPPGDRKIIHEFLLESDDLETESVGDGFNRRVVVKYTGNL